jgi:two-component system response regulator MtrA
VLIVDDDEGIGDTLATVLRHSGFRAHTALDGALAWETVEREKPDIVVTDYWITPVDGLQLIRRIRSRFVPGPLLGLMTADICLDWDIRKELQRSGVGIIDKPFWSEEFVTFVQNLIARQDASPRG